jgi:D-arabinose 1-dehydrogenase-like Zn-dependent alcohol dehydrogenase
MATMKAAVARTFKAPLRIEEVPVPSPGPGEVLVKIRATGVCHTDLHAVDGDWPVKPTLPLIPGHEGAGEVAANPETDRKSICSAADAYCSAVQHEPGRHDHSAFGLSDRM